MAIGRRIVITLSLILLALVSWGQPLPLATSDVKMDTPVYEVVVVGGGPAGIGAALAAAKVGARTALVERDSRIGGTTVQAEVCDIGLFYAWRRQIISGPVWDLVTEAVAAAHGSLPDFSKQEPDKWMESCVHVDPDIYSRVAEETLRKAGVDLILNVEVTTVERVDCGWRVGPVMGRQVVDATGNATVAALAGAERVKPSDDARQPGSYFFWISSQGLEFDAEAGNRAHKQAIADGELLPTRVLHSVGRQFNTGCSCRNEPSGRGGAGSCPGIHPTPERIGECRTCGVRERSRRARNLSCRWREDYNRERVS